MTEIIINGREVEADPSQPLIHACHKEVEDVPHYCYHPGLSPVGSCRICQVEVTQGKAPPRVVVACRTPISEGMIVNTEAPKAHEARRECLEFLLKNHPLDCPICDKAGECTLQDYSFDEGQGVGRSSEPRRNLEKRKSLGDVIVLDQERCILCSRCVRFFEEVTEKPQLVVSQRGAHSVIETFGDRPLTGNYQGNVADLCPVGALTLDKFRFQARVWNLVKTASTCAECSRGCAITTEVLRNGDVKRFRPRHDEAVNGYWMCDTGRFAFEHTDKEGRLAGAAIRSVNGFESTDTNDALDLAADMLVAHPSPTVVLSPFITLEEAEAVLALTQRLGVKPVFVSPPANELKDDLLHTGDPCPNRKGLEELGIEGQSAEALGTALESTSSAVLVGDRVAALLGHETLAALPASKRLIVFDCHVCDVPATDVCIGTPNHVERIGTWINVDGIRRKVGAARSMPTGVWTLVRALEELESRLAPMASPSGAGKGSA